MKIYAYKKGLASVASLVANGMGVLYDTSKPRKGSVVMSWGASKLPSWSGRVKWVNNPAATKIVADKINWAKFCDTARTSPLEVGTPIKPHCLSYTIDQQVARDWAEVKGSKVLCRTKINASGGKGIVVARNPAQVVDAPLYSLYQKKTSEYRVMYSPTIGPVFVWSKRRPEGSEMDRDQLLIRTLDCGYVYQAEDSAPLPVIRAIGQVSLPLARLGLELLAYDVIYNSETDTAHVVEANTAPGLGDDTAPKVVDALTLLEAGILQRGTWP